MQDSNKQSANEVDALNVAIPLDDLAAPETKSQIENNPRLEVQRTRAAIKKKKVPTFTVGEMIPWKGVWFKIDEIDNSGIKLVLAYKEYIR